ncbi:MAG: isoprenylcysteine carboxylmethyltransferase family protein [Chloroflexi bacterium]|nr:isoprenylcysteine carboxylmethyltransferase family protein [Chloroflexota bacterium]
MKLKGTDILAQHIPELNSAGGRTRLALYAAFLFGMVAAYFVATDQIPTWSIDSQIVVMALGFLVLSLFFSRKQAYKQKYGQLAYRNAFVHYAIPGLALVFGAVAHAGYMNGPIIPTGWWSPLLPAFGWVMLIVGGALWIRSALVFGADNLTLLYVYHPEESRIVNTSIYGILRHPVYAGVLRVCIGLALINGNANAIAFAILAPLGFSGWIRLVEEKELIERFGESYLEHRRRVPAFWPRLQHFPAFFKFLRSGK